MDLRSLSDEALCQTLLNTEHTLVAQRFALSMNRLQNTAKINTSRKQIARLQTEIRRRELEAAAAKGSLRQRFAGLKAVREAESAEQGTFLDSVVDEESVSE